MAISLALLACGGREPPDDTGLHQDIVNSANGAEVTFDATILSEPVESGGHERFQVKDPAGDRLEIDHNTTLAPSVPAHAGDALVIHGQLYIDPGPRVGVHCTHPHPSLRLPTPRWPEFPQHSFE